MTELVEPKPGELAERASTVQQEIFAGCKAIRTAWVLLAAYLHEFHEERMWELLGHEELQEWLAAPEVEISPGHFHKLRRVYRELVVEREVDVEDLHGIDLAKLQMALPAVRDGKVTIEDAIADAQALGRRDMQERYAGDPNAKLDAGAEPERTECPTCGSWVESEKLEEAA